ncbi:MAG: RDD family protein [Opitutaceae bacterium]
MFTIIGGDGQEYGPVSAAQIRTWIAAGRASLDTKAKALGSEEWRRLADYPEFSGNTDEPPPIPSGGTSPPITNLSTETERGRRIGAAFLNACFYFLCTMPGSMVISRKLMEQYPEMAKGRIPRLDEFDVSLVRENLVWVLAGVGAGLLLQAILLAFRSQNLGKMAFGLSVVRVDNGQPAGFVRGALLRFLLPVTLLLALHFTTGLLGMLLLFVDFCFIFRADGRCLHDLIAGTITVRA